MCDVCNGATYQGVLAEIRSDIQTHGWTVQYVVGENDRNPSYAYTAGLSLYEHPEIIYYNWHVECSIHALGPLAQAVASGSRRFAEGDDLDGLFPYPEKAQLLHFPHSITHLIIANDLFRRPGQPPVPALQLVWPDCEPLLAGQR